MPKYTLGFVIVESSGLYRVMLFSMCLPDALRSSFRMLHQWPTAPAACSRPLKLAPNLAARLKPALRSKKLTCFRLAVSCRHGWLARHELFFYLLDSLMVLAWLLVMVPLHFGVHLRKLHGEVAHLVLTAPAKTPSGFMQAEGDRTLMADAHLQDVHRYPYAAHAEVV